MPIRPRATLSEAQPTPSQSRATPRPPHSRLTPPSMKRASRQDTATTLSPSVRRLVRQYDLDVTGIHGTGPSGRIRVGDVIALLAARGERPSRIARIAPRASAATAKDSTAGRSNAVSPADDRRTARPCQRARPRRRPDHDRIRMRLEQGAVASQATAPGKRRGAPYELLRRGVQRGAEARSRGGRVAAAPLASVFCSKRRMDRARRVVDSADERRSARSMTGCKRWIARCAPALRATWRLRRCSCITTARAAA